LIGFYECNDNAPVVSGIVGHEVELLGKIETEGNSLAYGGDGDKFGFEYDIVPELFIGINYPHYLASLLSGEGEFRSGSVSIGSFEGDVEYFAAKVGNGFFLYAWENEADFQHWYTKCKDLSHVSFYGPAMPEPGGFMLAGLGLLGVFHLTRRRQ
jgi:hypothetical protein